MSSSKALPFLTAALAAASLSACVSPPPIELAPRTPTEQFAATVKVTPQSIELAQNPQGLSQAQRAAVYDMLGRWRSASGGPILIEAPNGGEPTATRVSQLLTEYGVGAPDISLRRSNAAAGTPIRVSFPIYTAEIPECGKSWENLARPTNEQQANFGCAVSANIAAMVSNPNDLVNPKPDGSPDASRRQVVLEKYRAGADTAATAVTSANSKGN